jgi:signal transduction histidine kinase
MVEDCLMDYYGALTEKGITPEVYITENEIVRKLNPAAVDRILSNLMSNALKYTADKLKIELTDDGEIRFSNNAKELNELNVKKLFDRFYTVNTGKNSTGIGLSIAKALTEKMGGKISADHNNGMFSISIRF